MTATDHPSPQSSNMKRARDLVVGDRVVLSRPGGGEPVVRTVSRAITNYPLRYDPQVEQTDLRWEEKTPDYVPIGWGGDPDTQFTLAES